MKQIFYSNGKLFITGEYVVLDGGLAFSIPTKFGQDLVVENSENHHIDWKSYDSDGEIWLDEKIDFSEIFNPIRSGNSGKDTLIEILHQANEMNPRIFENSAGYTITTKLTFPRNWGLGSSSTLINNIAQWFKIDAFELLKLSFGGSGYDIANAQNDTAVLYQIGNEKPTVKPFVFQPNFSKNIFFVYLNQKQSSKEAIASYKNKKSIIEPIVKQIDEITKEAIVTDNVSVFASLMKKHEAILSTVLEIKPVQERLFPDFNGTVKSLGAWGGDFVLVISEENPSDYFLKKGYQTILTYKEMIL